MKLKKDEIREEYSEELIASGKKGKYSTAYSQGTNVVLIDPDLRKAFPDSESVNKALREYIEMNSIST